MASEEVLRKTLKNADGKPFQKYKGIQNNFVLEEDRKSTRLNSSHTDSSRMPSSA